MGTCGTRLALLRRLVVGVLVASASIAVLPCAVAQADTYTANAFAAPTFKPGSVNGQDGWVSATSGIPGSPTGEFDQGIVDTSTFYATTPSGFGAQAFRISNAYASGIFVGQTYSAHVLSPAGEGQSNSEFIAHFSFLTTTSSHQPGLYMSISPDNGTGGRMSWVGLADTAGGTLVTVADSPDTDGNFAYHDIALLPDGVPHTITLTIKFNPGPDNDLVGISYDGTDSGQCFTTWENFIRANPDGDTGAVLPLTDSLQFRTSVADPTVAGGGFLFGNVSIATDNGPGPAACDVDISKDPDSPTVTAGGLAGYRLTARNHGHLAARNLLLCDRIPRKTTFVSASRKLRRVGTKRCLFIPRLGPGKSTGVHLTLRVSANAAGDLDNIADITPEPPTGVPGTPPAVSEDVPPGVTTIPVAPIKLVKVIVKVRARKAAAPPPKPPAVTG